MCLVLRTNGVNHPHDMCEALARHVRSSNTSAYNKEKGTLKPYITREMR
ncbi:hypothetical protein HMPREF9148_00488 [Prevotella sp. F0091]|nr:hypothetical protein HMPREF9148_00488 [Prevotella sp. F0091]